MEWRRFTIQILTLLHFPVLSPIQEYISLVKNLHGKKKEVFQAVITMRISRVIIGDGCTYM